MTRADTTRILVRDTFTVAVCLWAALYALEAMKPGFASNYLSLPRGLLLVLGLAILSLSFDPMTEAPERVSPPAESGRWLFAAYTVIFLATCLGLGLSIWLTLMLAFVTLLALWAIRLEWSKT